VRVALAEFKANPPPFIDRYGPLVLAIVLQRVGRNSVAYCAIEIEREGGALRFANAPYELRAIRQAPPATAAPSPPTGAPSRSS